MANRFPLIVNPISKKIEELVSGDNLDLTGNGILAGSSLGTSGQYLKSTGVGLVWDNPGDVYLTTTQTLTNKTFTSCTISGSANIFSNIPNTALVNSSINVNGVAISLGGSVTTPDNNTTYSISAVDGSGATEKIIRLTSGGNAGSGVNDDVTFVAGNNVTLSRANDAITINSSFVDTDTVTRLQSATGGSLVSGDVTIAASGSSSVSQAGSIITISSTFTDTITRLRAGTGQVLASGDFTFLQGGASTVTQSGNDITISSLDTITRVRGGSTASYNTGDITIVGSGAATVSQTDSTITVNAVDTNTVTRLRGTAGGSLVSGDVTFTSTGSSTVSQVGNTINISSVDTNTTYTADANGGLSLSTTAFSLKNAVNFTDSRVIKWDNSNKQFTNSIITDDGSTVTIGGDFIVTGTTTTLNTQTLNVADNEIELRRGNNLVGSDGGIRINRTTNSSGVVQTFNSLSWFESGGYWTSYDGSIRRRFVTEDETQILTNKTLTSPILSAPTLGIATATTINGLAITTTASGTLTIANSKTLTANNTVTFSGTDGSTVAFRNGGSIAYTADTLATFATTTSTQLRGIISDSTGTGVLVFNQNPNFTDSIGTASTSFTLLNSSATSISAFGVATTITLGANGTGTTTIRNALTVNRNVTLGTTSGHTLTVTGLADFVNADITIRGTGVNPIRIGRGGNSIASNTRVGFDALQNNTTGSQNTAVGFEAGSVLNSGASNTAYGFRALRNANTGSTNTAVGRDSLLNLLIGSRNTALGSNTLAENQSGNNNVCVGHFAGYNCLGSGNVLIGPADDENSSNATYQPPSVSGDRQLIVGSGTGTWIRGDGNFDVTAPQNFNVGGSLIVSGNLTINGTTTTINSSVLSVDDKTIEIGSVANTTFIANVTNNSANITAITPTSNLIPGMVVSITTAGISVPVDTTIVSITGNIATLSNVVTGSSGSATFNAIGPSDTSADGGGIILKGTTEKKITWTDATDAWTVTEHVDLANTKQYRIGNVLIASNSQIGPSTGSFSLGAGVTASSLTSVGTLSSLSVSGAIDIGTAGNLTGNGSPAKLKINSSAQYDGIALGNGASYSTISRGAGAGLVFTANAAPANLGGSETTVFEWHSGSAGGGGPSRLADLSTSQNFRLGNIDSNPNIILHSVNNGTARIKFREGGSLTTGFNEYSLGMAGNANRMTFELQGQGEVAYVNENGIAFPSGKGIDFSATANAAGMTSELLDDYEEGTWTPTLNFSGNSVGLTYSRQAGKYVKVGNIVYCSGHFQVSNKGSSTGTAVVSGLPFTYAAVTGGWFFPMGVRGNLNVGGAESVSFYISSSASSSMTMYSCNTSGGSNAGVPDTAFNNSTEIDINVWFYVS